MGKFIYVFSKADRDKLSELGFSYICGDERQGAWVFENNAERFAEIGKIACVTTDTLYFCGREENTEAV